MDGTGVRRVMLVVGTTLGGTGAHVRMLAAGFGERGIAVSVAGPATANDVFSFAALPSVVFQPVPIGDRPRVRDVLAVMRLRRLLARWTADGRAADGRVADGRAGDERARLDGAVVHAHGLRAGAFTVLALAGVRRRARALVVVTVHNAAPADGGLAGLVYRVLARLVASGADLVLCVSPDLEASMRASGARRVARAVVAAPVRPPSLPVLDEAGGAGRPGSPVVLAVGRLTGQKGFGTLLDAATRWRDLDPRPRLVIAGDGPLAGELRASAAALAVDADFPGHAGDVPALLATSAVFVLPSWWEGQPLVLQEALRAGVPIVATRVGGVPELTGADAALLVKPGDAAGLAAGVRAVLTDPALAARLRAAAAERGARLPTEADAVTAALAAYAATPAGGR